MNSSLSSPNFSKALYKDSSPFVAALKRSRRVPVLSLILDKTFAVPSLPINLVS